MAAKDCDRNVTKADENAKAENLLVTFENFNCWRVLDDKVEITSKSDGGFGEGRVVRTITKEMVEASSRAS